MELLKTGGAGLREPDRVLSPLQAGIRQDSVATQVDPDLVPPPVQWEKHLAGKVRGWFPLEVVA